MPKKYWQPCTWKQHYLKILKERDLVSKIQQLGRSTSFSNLNLQRRNLDETEFSIHGTLSVDVMKQVRNLYTQYTFGKMKSFHLNLIFGWFGAMFRRKESWHTTESFLMDGNSTLGKFYFTTSPATILSMHKCIYWSENKFVFGSFI